MSNVKERESSPLMEKPQPVPGPESGLHPTSYSGLLSSQSQEHTPVSAVPTSPMDSPYPTPMPQDTATCNNPVNQGSPENGTPMPQPAPVNQEGTPNQTVTDSSQLADIGRRARRCRYFMVALLMMVIVVSIGIGVGFYQENESNKSAKLEGELAQMQRERENMFRQQMDAVNRDLARHAANNIPGWPGLNI